MCTQSAEKFRAAGAPAPEQWDNEALAIAFQFIWGYRFKHNCRTEEGNQERRLVRSCLGGVPPGTSLSSRLACRVVRKACFDCVVGPGTRAILRRFCCARHRKQSPSGELGHSDDSDAAESEETEEEGVA